MSCCRCSFRFYRKAIKNPIAGRPDTQRQYFYFVRIQKEEVSVLFQSFVSSQFCMTVLVTQVELRNIIVHHQCRREDQYYIVGIVCLGVDIKRECSRNIVGHCIICFSKIFYLCKLVIVCQNKIKHRSKHSVSNLSRKIS